MTILLYDYVELEEKPSKGYTLWKGCHITSYILAAVFGLLNFYFLYIAMKTFGEQCVLDPHDLVFKEVAYVAPGDDAPVYNDTVEIVNLTAVNGARAVNDTDPIMVLDLLGSQFQRENYCELALYTPILSTIFGIVWCTLFTMCPAGGRGKRGMTEPWRILAPALVFALVFLFFTGHNFFATNGGIQALCRNFSVVTNTTSCSKSIDAHMPRDGEGWAHASLALGLTRAACAGTWACWACACALLLARCLAAPDFMLRRTEVVVHADPSKKLQSLLKPKPRRVTINERDIHKSTLKEDDRRSDINQDKSVISRDDDSLDSDPTVSSELPTISYGNTDGRTLNGGHLKETNGKNDIELAYAAS